MTRATNDYRQVIAMMRVDGWAVGELVPHPSGHGWTHDSPRLIVPFGEHDGGWVHDDVDRRNTDLQEQP